MNYITVTADTVGLAVIIILFFANMYGIKRHDRTERGFGVVCLVMGLALIFEILFNVLSRYPAVKCVFLELTTLTGLWLSTSFVGYLYLIIKQKTTISRKIVQFDMILFAVIVIINIIVLSTGNMCYVEDGIFNYGQYRDEVYALNISPCLIALYMVLKYWKALGDRDSWALLSYLATPGIAQLLTLIFPSTRFIFIVVALGVLVLYVIIEDRYVDTFAERENAILEDSKTDILTGLQNRVAYDELLRSQKLAKVGVFFTDVNNLKTTNDTLGHAAGDELLKRYAEILKGVFRYKDLFRIGGDEFVVVMLNAPEEVAEFKRGLLLDTVSHNDDIASIGYSYGNTLNLNKLIKEAEELMYEDKKKYHEKHGIKR